MNRRKPSLRMFFCLLCCMFFAFLIVPSAFSQPVPGGTLDPTTIPKYVQPLVIPPQMPASAAGVLPVANYNIAVRQFKQQILPGGVWNTVNGRNDLFPATTIWSYGRAEDPLPDSSAIGGAVGVAPAMNSTFNYPALTIENTSAVATKVRWINDLKDPTTGNFLPHLFPVDQTLHWANPPTANCVMDAPNRTDCETAVAAPYVGPVPLVTHVHGAHVQPDSDGYPEAWWLPAANNIPAGYSLRGSHYGQSDNNNAVPGSAFYTYENTQAASTIWYHDHALGMTRLNVYAGPAGFWLIRGGANDTAPGVLPGPAPSGAGDPNFNAAYRATIREIPIAIQDRSFNTNGSLFYPQNRAFFDGFAGPYIGGTGTPAGPSDIPPIWNPEAFFNTMVVNGTTWPKFEVRPARYRLRLLNGCNSRTLNLSMFVVTGPGIDTIMGTADDDLGTEVPIYQIGAEQGFLPNVVKIVTGFATPLPGNGTTPGPVAAPHPSQALLMGNAERADVIVDFGGMANGTRIRIINTAPDAPFGGFPDVAADPGTTGQVMDFIVNTALPAQPTDTSSTPPVSLILPAKAPLGAPTNTRQVSLNELSSDQVCVEVNSITGAIVGTLFSTTPGDSGFLTDCAAATPTIPGNLTEPMGPRQAQVGILTTSGGNLVALPKRWGETITETPLLNSTEIWEIFNTTADAHPIHLHLVDVQVVNREDLDPTALLAGNLVPTGTTYAPLPNEAGYKDTVLTYPGQITRIKAKFDIAGLYVWHCHIVEHEDNEMMRPFIVNSNLLYGDFDESGIWSWNGTAWSQIDGISPGINPAGMVVSGTTLYANFTGYGLYQWNGTTWTQINPTVPASMVVSGTTLYANFTGYGLYQWNGTTWTYINPTVPASMVVSGTTLYANFTGYGLYQWNGTTWTYINPTVPASMVASGAALYADFTGYGIYKYEAGTWTNLSPTDPSIMVAGF
jgi:spore coat protein A